MPSRHCSRQRAAASVRPPGVLRRRNAKAGRPGIGIRARPNGIDRPGARAISSVAGEGGGQQKPRTAAAARRQQQTARSRKVIESCGNGALGQNAGDSAGPQGSLHREQRFLRVVRPHDQQPGRIEPGFDEAGAIGHARLPDHEVLDDQHETGAGPRLRAGNREIHRKSHRREQVRRRRGQDFVQGAKGIAGGEQGRERLPLRTRTDVRSGSGTVAIRGAPGDLAA